MASKEDMVSQTVDKLTDAAKAVQQSAEHFVEFARDAAGSAEAGLKDKAEQAEQVFASGMKSTTKFIKKYPVESALACFGVGCLLGVMLKRKS